MIKEALQYLVSLGKHPVQTVNDRAYWAQDGTPIKEPVADTLNVTTLGALVGYIDADSDRLIDRKLVDRMTAHVISPTEVALYAPADGDFCVRPRLVTAKPMLPDFPFGQFMDGEKMVIALQTCFARGVGDIGKVLAVAGNVSVGATRDVTDNGISQAVTVRTGVAALTDVMVPNPVALAPFRTFLEVEQPVSNFVFRARSNGGDKPTFALFEADGGAWRLEAMQNVAAWLEKEAKERMGDAPTTEDSDVDPAIFDDGGIVINVIY